MRVGEETVVRGSLLTVAGQRSEPMVSSNLVFAPAASVNSR